MALYHEADKGLQSDEGVREDSSRLRINTKVMMAVLYDRYRDKAKITAWAGDVSRLLTGLKCEGYSLEDEKGLRDKLNQLKRSLSLNKQTHSDHALPLKPRLLLSFAIAEWKTLSSATGFRFTVYALIACLTVGMFRFSELVDLTWSRVEWSEQGVAFILEVTKERRRNTSQGVRVLLPSLHSPWLDPKALLWHLANNGPPGVPVAQLLKSNSPVFALAKGALSKNRKMLAVTSLVREVFAFNGLDVSSHSVGTHSCRSGGATHYLESGVPIPSIAHAGRWNSEAVYRYFRLEDEKERSRLSSAGRITRGGGGVSST